MNSKMFVDFKMNLTKKKKKNGQQPLHGKQRNNFYSFFSSFLVFLYIFHLRFNLKSNNIFNVAIVVATGSSCKTKPSSYEYPNSTKFRIKKRPLDHVLIFTYSIQKYYEEIYVHTSIHKLKHLKTCVL